VQGEGAVRVNDAVSGIVLVLFALAMMAYTLTFPAMPGQDYGPALFPVLIGIGFLICGIILIVSGVRRRAVEPWFSGGEWLRSPPNIIDFLGVVGGLVAYILLSDWLGFIPTAFLLLFGWLIMFRGGKPLSSAAIALGATLVVNYAFTQLLLVPLPLGLLRWVLYN
jgi:putative tricarboxylic transport membrane protein